MERRSLPRHTFGMDAAAMHCRNRVDPRQTFREINIYDITSGTSTADKLFRPVQRLHSQLSMPVMVLAWRRSSASSSDRSCHCRIAGQLLPVR